MSEHFFGLGMGEVREELREKLDAVAQRHDGAFVNVKLPGEGWRYWFAIPNLGSPFNEATARVITAECAPIWIAEGDKDGEP